MGRPAVDLEVAIPAFNEAARLPATIRRTVEFLAEKPWSSRVVVVDNGSSDATSEVAHGTARTLGSRRVPVEVLGCARPGKGAAVRRAAEQPVPLRRVLRRRSRHAVETLTAAMAELSNGAAAVVGSRHAAGSELKVTQSAGRRVGGSAFRVVARSLVPGVQDTQCGFKFFERETMTRAFVSCRTSGFAFDVELLRALQRDGGRIVEVPVVWSDQSSSTFQPIRDGVTSFGDVLAMHRRVRL